MPLAYVAKIANICHNLFRGDNYGNDECFFTRPYEKMG